MRYKLKEHVTNKMLEECGFSFDKNSFLYIRNDSDKPSPKNIIVYRTSRRISFNWDEYDIADLPNYIKDLIDLGYVEVIEWQKKYKLAT